jgi:hypothetical protein
MKRKTALWSVLLLGVFGSFFSLNLFFSWDQVNPDQAGKMNPKQIGILWFLPLVTSGVGLALINEYKVKS